MIPAPPETNIYVRLDDADPGLAAVIEVSIVDSSDVVVYGPTNVGVTEFPVASGFYKTSITTPAEPGNYDVLWDVNGALAREELLVINPLHALQVLDAFASTFSSPEFVSFTLNGAPWPDGTTVKAYVDVPEPGGYSGEPYGDVAATDTSMSNEVTFTGLARGGRYIAAAQVAGSWVRVRFRT